MHRASLFLTYSLALLPLLAACGGNVVVDSPSGATAGAGGAVGTTVGAGGAVGTTVGVGGAVGTTVGVGGAMVGTTVGAGGASVSCGGPGVFEIVVDGNTFSLTSSCTDTIPEAKVPYGQENPTGPVGTQGLFLEACRTPANGSQGITGLIQGAFGPGSYAGGALGYRDPGGVVSTGPFKMNISEIDPVGGSIVGVFQMTTFSDAGPPHVIGGKFVICRLPDI